MDLSALIFVALAVAWAAYLIPKALKHHEEDQRSRTVDSFSSSMRVLASRDSLDGRTARLVVPGRPASAALEIDAAAASAARFNAGRASAARRRRRVLTLVLLAIVAVAALAATGVVAWALLAVPGGLLVAWLVACRLMVRSERRARQARRARVDTRLPGSAPTAPETEDEGPLTEEIAVVPVAAAVDVTVGAPEGEAGEVGWDPVPVTLPTYVTKEPAARRSVRTIDLDSTGVWTSGRSEIDSALARGAEEAERADKAARKAEAKAEQRRASGS